MDTLFTLQIDHDDTCTILHVSMTSMWPIEVKFHVEPQWDG